MIEKTMRFRLRSVFPMSPLLLAFVALLTILLFVGGYESATGTPDFDDGWRSVLNARTIATVSAPGELPHIEEKSSALPIWLASIFPKPLSVTARSFFS